MVKFEQCQQARAAGIQCGDGCDPHNLATQTFRRADNKSLQQAKQLCPNLVTKPMRSDRYRQARPAYRHNFCLSLLACANSLLLLQVSAQILTLISQSATNGNCEKTSYDDFYVEIVPDNASLVKAGTWLPPADHVVHVLGDGSFSALPAVLKCAVQVDVLCNLNSLCLAVCLSVCRSVCLSACMSCSCTLTLCIGRVTYNR